MKQKLLISLLILSLLLNAVFIFRKVYYYFHYKSKPVLTEKTSSDLYKEVYKHCPYENQEIIFLGNSITAAFKIEEFLPDYKIKNRGISGNTTIDIINRIEDITRAKPCKLFIMIGINDIVDNIPVNVVLNNYSIILEKIKNQSPETKVFVQSILPVTKHASNFFFGNENTLNPLIDEVNNSLSQLAKEKGLIYIDLNELFILNEELNQAYSWDGIHINAKGYERWLEHIKPYIVINK
ncbi:MAG: GDSL-type esterase/lipase family protein [Bacteroidales bacterium]